MKKVEGSNALGIRQYKQIKIIDFGINKLKQDMSVKEFVGQIDKFLFDDPVQRNSDVWDNEKKSLLIHSVLMRIPIPNIYVQQIGEKLNVIDGKQRLTTLMRFVENKFALDIGTPAVTVKTEEGVIDFPIAAATFEDLPVEFQDRILSHTIVFEVLQMSDDIKNIVFDRLNNNESLKPTEKLRSIMTLPTITYLAKMGNEPLIKKINMSERKRNRLGDQEVILQSLLVIEKNGETGIGSRDIKEYVKNGISEQTRILFENAVNYLNGVIEYIESNALRAVLKKTHVPMLCLTALQAKDIEPEKFAEWATTFLYERYKDHRYKDFASFGSAKKENVGARCRLMLKDFKQTFGLPE